MTRLATLVLPLFAQAVIAVSPPLQVVASGETHAMLRACDCPDNPGGGLAERAALIDSLRTQGPLLLLDAGGFSGGGIYDTYTEGRARDSLRTLAVIKAMAHMGYDAVVPGDDDLQYGATWLTQAAGRYGLKLVCANAFGGDGKLLASPYVLVRVGGVTVGVTGVTTAERLFAVDTTVVVTPAVGALKAIWQELRAKSGMQIILSHLGEEVSASLADSFPQASIVVNGHRKSSPQPAVQRGNTVVMQFGFQGKELSRVGIDISSRPFAPSPGEWVEVGRGLRADSTISALLDIGSGRPNLPYDLYIMSQCPYGLPALGEFADFLKRFPDLEWGVWFIGTVEADGALTSLHGSAEAADEQLWLAVKALYPGRWLEFLAARAKSQRPTDSLAAQMGFDLARLREWVARHGATELTMHYRRSMRTGVSASPTLLRANVPLEVDISALRLAKGACDHGDVDPADCRALPICLDDRDCRKPGRIGRCVQKRGRAACEFRRDARFGFIALVPDTNPDPGVASTMQTTRDLFPAAVIERVLMDSPKGRRLIEALKPPALPLYLFERGVTRAAGFRDAAPGLAAMGEYFTFRPGVMPLTYFLNRPVTRDVTLYLDPLLPGIGPVLEARLSSIQVRVRPLLVADPSRPSSDSLVTARWAEARRWLVLDSIHPGDIMTAYLRAYASSPDSSLSLKALAARGVDVLAFSRAVTADSVTLQRAWMDERELGVEAPVALLVGNRRLVRVRDVRELGVMLARLARQ